MKKMILAVFAAITLLLSINATASPEFFQVDNSVNGFSWAVVQGQWAGPVAPKEAAKFPWGFVIHMCGKQRFCHATIMVQADFQKPVKAAQVLLDVTSGSIIVLNEWHGYKVDVTGLGSVQLLS